ncbi:TVP38/TMEM64 family protein [Alkalihalobacillus sp. AL-G]|uniref:TVP38/TMEM64 family protein n=1 Tax=Alkalihalobacillus sp. AL-G TaxID=2926399 RepID=UPI00272CF67B|nr:TVP38/TMEM64 family protein [Alkalihalobacillus sp. AL-G]WLD91915.1 TVP38/TMEM64 family protein [Alkalihalobacillus sp. AL-G]
MNKKKLIRNLIMTVIILTLFLWLNHTFLKIPPEEIRNWVLSFGWIAPGIYLILFTIRPFVLFPSSLLAIVGGLAFGFWYGFGLTMVGTCLGAVVSFLAVRRLGITVGRVPSKPKYDKIREQINRRGFYILIVLRLLPFLHFEIVTYLSAVSTIRFSHYLWATFLGVVPGAFIYCGIGSSAYSGGNEIIILSIILLVVLTIFPFLFRKQLSSMLAFKD